MKGSNCPTWRHGHTNRLTVRWGPAKRGEAASADSDASALPTTGAKRRCRVPLMPFGFFRGVSLKFRAKRRKPLQYKRYEFRIYAVFIFAFFRLFRIRARKPSKTVDFVRNKKGASRHLAKIKMGWNFVPDLGKHRWFRRQKRLPSLKCPPALTTAKEIK